MSAPKLRNNDALHRQSISQNQAVSKVHRSQRHKSPRGTNTETKLTVLHEPTQQHESVERQQPTQQGQTAQKALRNRTKQVAHRKSRGGSLAGSFDGGSQRSKQASANSSRASNDYDGSSGIDELKESFIKENQRGVLLKSQSLVMQCQRNGGDNPLLQLKQNLSEQVEILQRQRHQLSPARAKDLPNASVIINPQNKANGFRRGKVLETLKRPRGKQESFLNRIRPNESWERGNMRYRSHDTESSSEENEDSDLDNAEKESDDEQEVIQRNANGFRRGNVDKTLTRRRGE